MTDFTGAGLGVLLALAVASAVVWGMTRIRLLRPAGSPSAAGLVCAILAAQTFMMVLIPGYMLATFTTLSYGHAGEWLGLDPRWSEPFVMGSVMFVCCVSASLCAGLAGFVVMRTGEWAWHRHGVRVRRAIASFHAENRSS